MSLSNRNMGQPDLNSAIEFIDEAGRECISVPYINNDGELIDYMEFYKGDYIPIVWLFSRRINLNSLKTGVI